MTDLFPEYVAYIPVISALFRAGGLVLWSIRETAYSILLSFGYLQLIKSQVKLGIISLSTVMRENGAVRLFIVVK